MISTVASILIRSARVGAGLSQRDLAQRTKTHQSGLASIESGQRDTTVNTLLLLLNASGSTITSIPGHWTPVALGAVPLCRGSTATRLRHFIQLSDDLASADPATRIALTIAEPAPTGDAGWDAALAALVEYRLGALPKPKWISKGNRYCSEPFFVDNSEAARQYATEHSPKVFAKRNVFLADSELQSV